MISTIQGERSVLMKGGGNWHDAILMQSKDDVVIMCDTRLVDGFFAEREDPGPG